jgi:hypothetical protein
MDIGEAVKAGDLGGYVENESNLSFEPGDEAWLFDDSICCGEAHVCKGAVLRDGSMAKDRAYISYEAELFGLSMAEDDAIVRGGLLSDFARVSGNGMLLQSTDTGYRPKASCHAAIYGKVIGNYLLSGDTVVIPGEEFHNDSPDRFYVFDNKRTVQRDAGRDEPEPKRIHRKSREQNR